MTPERWQQIREVLDAALLLQSGERVPFLEKIGSSDPDLRREVESLLSSDEQAGSRFLNTPVINLNAPAPAISGLSHVGRRIGVYDILEEIGRGGMGEVYRAARADGQYKMEVAVKLVRGGSGTSSALERFRMERQILASLDHPNIARMLDGGTTDDGIPYLVMELIVASPIDDYCDAHKLSVSQRLHLFRQVCAAVQYAHQRLVIHRDLKPSNILVTADGTPKLLDFGIAKLLDPAITAQSTLAHPMTPEYASPEQIRGETITTATDVYSLGVVLYQLLTGRSPYPKETRTSHELARAICDTDPTRPSTAVLKPLTARGDDKSEANTPEDVSGSREGSPARLKRRLAGDLDNIVLQALRKEPQRRYPSVEQFAEDIRRHLEGLPVVATKGSWRYRAGKFVTRHKVAVVATTAVLLALIGGVAATVRAARVARQQAEIARVERERAEKRFDDVRKLANSLIFEIHDSIQNLPGAAPSRKLLLDRAVEYLDKLSQESNGDVDLQRELAWGYQRLAAVQGDTSSDNLGQITDSEASNRKAIALFEAIAKANPHNVTDQLNLAMTYRTRAFSDIFVPGGVAEINQALAVTTPLMQSDGSNLAVKHERSLEYQILGAAQDAVGDPVAAVDSFRKLLQLHQEIERVDPKFKNVHVSIAKSMILLAYQLGRMGSFDESMALMQTGITTYQALAKDPGTPDLVRDLAASVIRRGDIELMQGRTSAAHASYAESRALLIRLVKLDPDNLTYRSDLGNLDYADGRLLLYTKHYPEALIVLQRSFDDFVKLQLEGDTGPGIGAMQLQIGEAEAGTHNPTAAITSYQKAAAAFAKDESNYDQARCGLAAAYSKLGDTLFQLGRPREASDWYMKAVDKASLGFAIQHNDIPAFYPAAQAYAGLARLSASRAANAAHDEERARQWNSARDYYQKSLDAWRKIPNPTRVSSDGFMFDDPQQVAREAAAVVSHQSHQLLGGEKGDKRREDKGMFPRKHPKDYPKTGPWPPKQPKPPKPPKMKNDNASSD